MRIEDIQLRWFRGAASESAFGLEGKSAVIYGPNASGKSTLTDAIEYLLAEGPSRISHLSHEYSGTRQVDGTRNTHITLDSDTEIEISFTGNQSIKTVIHADGTQDIVGSSEEITAILESWDPAELILRQDGLAKFINKTKGEKYTELIPLLGLEPFEAAAENVRRLRQQVRQRSHFDRKLEDATLMRTRVETAFESAALTSVHVALTAVWLRYFDEDMPGDTRACITRLGIKIADRVASADPERRLHFALDAIKPEQLLQSVTAAITTKKLADDRVDELLDSKIPILTSANAFINALPDEQTEVNCPACGTRVVVEQFRKHVEDELSALTEARTARNAAIDAMRAFLTSLRTVQGHLGEEPVSIWATDADAKNDIAAVLATDPTIIDSFTVPMLEQFKEQIDATRVCIEAATASPPPGIEQLITDKETIATAQEFLALDDLERECIGVQQLLDALEACEQRLRDAIGVQTAAVLAEISHQVQNLWSTLHPVEPITDVHLYMSPETDKGIDVALTFYGKDQPSPRLTLSEGHRNSMGLCIFLALLLREGKENMPVILDDIVSSFDREHRGLVMNVLLEHFSHRQVILLTHDREWFAELRQLLPQQQWKFVRLGRWDGPEVGIQVIDASDTFEEALEQLAANPELASTRARAILDRELPRLAERLRLPVPHLCYDRNDHRTAVEFLDRLVSEAPNRLEHNENGTWVPFDEPVTVWRATRALLVARANRDTHGGTGAIAESQGIIDSCHRSIEAVRCSQCGSGVWERNDEPRERLYCEGNHLRWKYG